MDHLKSPLESVNSNYSFRTLNKRSRFDDTKSERAVLLQRSTAAAPVTKAPTTPVTTQPSTIQSSAPRLKLAPELQHYILLDEEMNRSYQGLPPRNKEPKNLVKPKKARLPVPAEAKEVEQNRWANYSDCL